MPITITIPLIKDVKQLLLFLEKYRDVHRDKTIILDFSNYTFVKPYHLTPLACLIAELKLRNNVVQFTNIAITVNSYLETVGFLSLVENEDSLTKIDVGFSDKSSTYVKLWKIDSNQIQPYVIYASRLFKSNNLHGKNLDALTISLAEVFNNIIDHSNSIVGGYVVTQFYPQMELLMTSICDFGIGIPNKINKFAVMVGEEMRADVAALELALTHGYSTKSAPHNKGFGLPNVISCVKGLGNSSIKIISNNAVYLIDNQGDEYLIPNLPNFSGTMIVICLDTKNLPLDEDFIENEAYL